MSEWISVEERLPVGEVVLAAVESYDCGWVADTAWYSHHDKKWYTTGSVNSTPAHMKYTHWRKLPPMPQ